MKILNNAFNAAITVDTYWVQLIKFDAMPTLYEEGGESVGVNALLVISNHIYVSIYGSRANRVH